jgi:hypothetical protein
LPRSGRASFSFIAASSASASDVGRATVSYLA